jgi:predicted PurR-regulated permease PerM
MEQKNGIKHRNIIIVNMVVVLIILIFFGIFYNSIMNIITPFIFGLVFAYLLNPLVKHMVSIGMNRILSIAILFILILSIIVVFSIIIFPLIIDNLTQFVDFIPTLISGINTLIININDLIKQYSPYDLNTILNLETEFQNYIQVATNGLIDFFKNLLSGVSSIVNIVMIPIITFFLLKDQDMFINWLTYFVPINWRSTTKRFFRDVDLVIGGYLKGQIILCIIAGVVTGVGCYIVDIPFALICGIVAGITYLIPYFGPVIAGVIIGSIAIVSNGWESLIAAIVILALVQVLCSNILGPMIMGSTIGIHPVTVIFAVFFFGSLMGLPGMILAIPIAGIIKVIAGYGKFVVNSTYKDLQY